MPEFAQIHSSRKRRWQASLFFIFLCLSLVARAETLRQRELLKGPFYWREKPALFEKMQKERLVPVSVTKKTIKNESLWFFKGAGIVETPKDFMFAEAQKYDKLSAMPDHFQNVSWDPQTQTLSLDVHFLMKVRRMKIRLEAKDGENLFFRVEEGWFQGFEGVLMIRKLSEEVATAEVAKKCEVGVIAVSDQKLGWVSGLIFSLAAEGVMHHVAESLRNVAETDYKKSIEKK
jgi:hypothetical protein